MTGWLERAEPLAPAAAFGEGPVARALARATARRLRDGRSLRVAFDDDVVLVLGATDDLPWVDGLDYLGWDDGVLVPTTLRTRTPPDLVRAAVADRTGADRVVALTPELVLVTTRPREPADPAALEAWARRP